VLLPAATVALERLHEHYGPFSCDGRTPLLQESRRHGLCLKDDEAGGPQPRCGRRPVLHTNPSLPRSLVGAETTETHAARLRELLEPHRVPAWPYAGAVALVERRGGGAREDLLVFDRWVLAGHGRRSLDAAGGLAATAPRVFDADLYRIAAGRCRQPMRRRWSTGRLTGRGARQADAFVR